MAVKNKSMYAILGILSLSPGTGYDIKKYSDRVLKGFWNENFGHIYPTLKVLLKEKMIDVFESDVRMKNVREEQKIKYQITEKGKQELERWLVEDTIQQPIRSEFMLKLLFSSSQPTEHVIHMLEQYKSVYEKRISGYSSMLQDLEHGIQEITKERARLIRAILRRGILSDEAVLAWCDETIDDLIK